MALILGNKLNNVLFGTNLVDTINGDDGDDFIVGLDGGDSLSGGAGADNINGSDGDDLLLGLAGDDMLTGGAGHDTLNGGVGADFMNGGAGNDMLNGGIGADSMSGGSGNDTYVVDSYQDRVSEAVNGGVDKVFSSVSFMLFTFGTYDIEDLTLTGTASINGAGNSLDNKVTGNSAANILGGYGGDDHLFGLGGNDQLVGGSGADVLDGGAGIDRMEGEAGNDTYFVDDLKDFVIEEPGSGIDKISSSIDTTLSRTGSHDVEGLTLTGQAATGNGNALANSINGNAVGNVLSGLEGGDSIFGWGGNDTLVGGNGNDTLNGGAGNDMIYTGAGYDTIVFNTAPSAANVDHVRDFSPASDIFHLENAVFTGLAANKVLPTDAFHIGGAAADAEDRIIYNSASGKLFFDRDGIGGIAQVQFATLATGLHLTLGDFYVV